MYEFREIVPEIDKIHVSGSAMGPGAGMGPGMGMGYGGMGLGMGIGQGMGQGMGMGPGMGMGQGMGMGPGMGMGYGGMGAGMGMGPGTGMGPGNGTVPNSNGIQVLWEGNMPKPGFCFGILNCNSTHYVISNQKLEEIKTTTHCGLCAKKDSVSVQAKNISEINSREVRVHNI